MAMDYSRTQEALDSWETDGGCSAPQTAQRKPEMKREIPVVTSDQALSLLRRVASGQVVPRLKNADQHWNDETVELVVDGWKLVVFTDNTRSRHLDSITSPDGHRGDFDNWRSDVEFSQQPEDRLYRQDSDAVNRMLHALRQAK
jgi:hypothetical protein